MSTANIGNLEVLLTAQTAEFQKGMDAAIKQIARVDESVRKSGQTLNGVSAQFAKVGQAATSFAQALGVVGALGIAKQLAATADAAADTAAGFGIATTEVYAFQRALLASGGQVDGVGKQFGKISDLINDAFEGVPKARQQLEGLGISLKSIQSASVSEVYQVLVASIASIEDPAKRSAVAMEIFGKSILGTDMKKLNQDLDDTKKRYKEYENSINAAADAYDNLELAANTASFYATVGVGKATEAIQVLIQQFKNFKDLLTGNATLAETIMKPVQQANERAAESAARAAERTAQLQREIKSLQGTPTSAFDSWILGLKKSTEEAGLFTQKMDYLNKMMAQAVTSTEIKTIQVEMEKLNGIDPFEAWKDSVDKSLVASSMLVDQLQYLAELRNLDFITLQEYNKEIEKIGYGTKAATAETEKLGAEIAQAIGQNANNAVNNFIDNIGKAKFSFSDFAESVIKDLAKVAVQMLIMKPLIGALTGGIASFLPVGGPTLLASGSSDGRSASSDETSSLSSVSPFQMRMASTSIPTMSRSGPSLSVAAAPMNVVINNTVSNDTKVTVAETQNNDGMKQLTVMVERQVKEMFGTGAMDKSMRASYGLMRVAT
jgi:hypothetical protein